MTESGFKITKKDPNKQYPPQPEILVGPYEETQVIYGEDCVMDSNRLTDLVARLRHWGISDCQEAADAIEELMAALKLFIAYDDTDDEDGVKMMVRYDEAIRAARAAVEVK